MRPDRSTDFADLGVELLVLGCFSDEGASIVGANSRAIGKFWGRKARGRTGVTGSVKVENLEA
jgi:hypothetical protein